MANPSQNGSYQVFSPYNGTDNGCTSGVFLLPPSFQYGQPLNLIIRFLYIGGTNFSSYTYSNADFQFSVIKGQQQGNGPAEINLSITVLANNVWKCSSSARQALTANFTDFITQIESQFEINATPILIPGATSIIAGQLAEIMPAPLTETLFYRYGFNSGLAGAGAPSINLTPGMRLRVDFEATQFISPSSPFNSYISNGQFYYYICSVPGSNNQRLLAFDPFLGNITGPKIPQSGSAPFSASGIIDIESAGMARRYYKLVYPQNMIAGNSPGDSTSAKNVSLIGANSLADLNAGTGSAVSSIFRGRAVVVPEIPVWLSVTGQQSFNYSVNGLATVKDSQYSITGQAITQQTGSPTQIMQIYVPVGTTVANILERYTTWKPIYLQQQVIGLVRLQTGSGKSTGNQSVSYKSVTFPYAVPNTLVGNLQSFDLPLTSGDAVSLNFG